MAGMNPQFNVGFNPTPHVGYPQHQFPPVLMAGYNPAPSNLPPTLAAGSGSGPWLFNEQMGTVLHAPNTYSHCDAMIHHIVMAMALNDSMYKTASAEHVEHFRREALGPNQTGEDLGSLNCRVGELATQLSYEKSVQEQLNTDLSRVRSDRDHAYDGRDKARAEETRL